MPDREVDARGEPGLELLPDPVVHADLAATTALASAHQHGTASLIEVRLAQRERVVDAQARAPQHDDERSQPRRVQTGAGVPHHGDDLSHRGRGYCGGRAISLGGLVVRPARRTRRHGGAAGEQR
jgi:hypothetical protein